MPTIVSQGPLESTQELVARALKGDRMARDRIAGRYHDTLLQFGHGRLPRLARGLVETVDVVQEVLGRVLGRLDRVDASEPGSLLAYLRESVLNQIRDEIRRAERRPRTTVLGDLHRALDPDPLDAAISRQEGERYTDGVLRLPAVQREAFLMKVEMGRSYREIADRLGRPSQEAARMLVRRAIFALTKMLRESETR